MSLREIAREAGVSIATASRVLNNTALHKVSEKTRLRVLEVARAHRYRPNRQAVALASGRAPNTLGLILPYGSPIFDTFYFSQIATAVADVAAGHSMDLSLLVVRDRTPERFLDFLSGHHVSGAILLGGGSEDAALVEVADPRMPFVVINSSQPAPDALIVTCDNRGGARAMTQHLLDHGHTRIAFIAGVDVMRDSHERLAGFLDAHAEAGVPVDQRLIAPGGFSEDGGRAAMTAFLKVDPRPTAVFAANDQSAIGAMLTLKAAGLRIPEDVALAGFDNIPFARYLGPPLTTVHQPFYRLGEAAAMLALSVIGGADVETMERVHVIPTHLVPRASCGCRPPG